MDKTSPIAVLDSGVGGLSVLKALQELMPAENYIYLGDTARAPYGVRSEQEIRAMTEEILEYFASVGVKLVVVACNTITSLGVGTLREKEQMPIVGMTRGAQEVLALSKTKKIGLFATPFTIQSGRHALAVFDLDPTADVIAVPCPKFVTLVERGCVEGPEVEAAMAEYARPLQAAGADVLILGCTHFPFLRSALERYLGAEMKIFDPAAVTAQIAQEYLQKHDLLRSDRVGSSQIYFTGDVAQGEAMGKRILTAEKCYYSALQL